MVGRAGERLEAALSLVAERRRAFEHAVDAATREWTLARYRRAPARAPDARPTLIIHRAGLRLRNHRIVDQQFSEPPVPRWPNQNFPGPPTADAPSPGAMR